MTMHVQELSPEADASLLLKDTEPETLSAYSQYSREIGHYPLLTLEQEQELAIQARRGDCAACHALICGNLRLVLTVARTYRREHPCGTYSFLDLVQVGNLGLMRAAEKFDPERGTRFSTHAVWWIRQAIGRFVAEESASVHLPSYIMDEWRSLRRGSEGEVSEELLSGPLRAALTWLARPVVSLDASVDEQETPLAELLAEPVEEKPGLDATQVTALQQVLAQIPVRHRQVLDLRYGESLSLRAVAARLGVSAERVRQLEQVALLSLHGSLSAAGVMEEANPEDQGRASSSSPRAVVKEEEASAYVPLREVARQLQCSVATVRGLASRLGIVSATLMPVAATAGRRETGYHLEEVKRIAQLRAVTARRREPVLVLASGDKAMKRSYQESSKEKR